MYLTFCHSSSLERFIFLIHSSAYCAWKEEKKDVSECMFIPQIWGTWHQHLALQFKLVWFKTEQTFSFWIKGTGIVALSKKMWHFFKSHILLLSINWKLTSGAVNKCCVFCFLFLSQWNRAIIEKSQSVVQTRIL